MAAVDGRANASLPGWAPVPEVAALPRPEPARGVRALAGLGGRIGLAAAVGILALFVAAAAFAPWIAPHDPLGQDTRASLTPPAWSPGGSRAHPLGTDLLGRDVLSRIIHGARISLVVGVLSVAATLLAGVVLGLAAGYYGGVLDDLLMRLADVQLAIPMMVFAVAIMAVLGASLVNLVLVLAITGWVLFSRVTRGIVLSLREWEFVQATQALGSSDRRVVLRHLLPHLVSPLVALATLEVGRRIVFEASLSFLGLGVRAPTPSWGSMLSDGREYLLVAWWPSTFPGLAITAVVLSLNLLGDWLRDRLDPRLRTAGR
jgi:peptide/nickel transport system permease protein